MKAEIEQIPFNNRNRGIDVTSETPKECQLLEELWSRKAAAVVLTRNADTSVTLTIRPIAE